MSKEPTLQGKQVRSMYSVMTSIENNLGGGEGIEGLYGSISGCNMQRMLTVMRERCGLDSSSHLVDIGAGLGRPLLHALFTEKISGATGIELDPIKCMKARAFLRQTALVMMKKGLIDEMLEMPVIDCRPVEKVRSLDPATHAYSFWEGVPVDARVAFGSLFAASRTLQSVTVVQRSMRSTDPAAVMDDNYGFGPLVLVDTFAVQMSGSGRSFAAYVFNKVAADGGGGGASVSPLRRGGRMRAAAGVQEATPVRTPPRSVATDGSSRRRRRLRHHRPQSAAAVAAVASTHHQEEEEEEEEDDDVRGESEDISIGGGAQRKKIEQGVAKEEEAAESAVVEAVWGRSKRVRAAVGSLYEGREEDSSPSGGGGEVAVAVHVAAVAEKNQQRLNNPAEKRRRGRPSKKSKLAAAAAAAAVVVVVADEDADEVAGTAAAVSTTPRQQRVGRKRKIADDEGSESDMEWIPASDTAVRRSQKQPSGKKRSGASRAVKRVFVKDGGMQPSLKRATTSFPLAAAFIPRAPRSSVKHRQLVSQPPPNEDLIPTTTATTAIISRRRRNISTELEAAAGIAAALPSSSANLVVLQQKKEATAATSSLRQISSRSPRLGAVIENVSINNVEVTKTKPQQPQMMKKQKKKQVQSRLIAVRRQKGRRTKKKTTTAIAIASAPITKTAASPMKKKQKSLPIANGIVVLPRRTPSTITTTTTSTTTPQKPKSPPSSSTKREARGLSSALGGSKWQEECATVAEYLNESQYPRTRHAYRELTL